MYIKPGDPDEQKIKKKKDELERGLRSSTSQRTRA